MTDDDVEVEHEHEHEIGHEGEAEPSERRAVRERIEHGLAVLPRPLALAIAFTALTRLVVWVRFVRFVGMSGDETYYWKSSQSLIDLVGFGDVSSSEALDQIILRGWFMPGMSALMVPVRLFTDDVAVGRLWIGAINFVLFVVILHVVHRRFGIRSAWAFWFICTFMPTVVLFSFSFWGEIPASAIIVLLTLAAVTEARRAFDWRSSQRWVLIGVGLGVLTYIRPSMLIISGVIVVAILLANLGDGGWTHALRATWRPTLVVALTSLVMILPWSIALSEDKGGPYLTTTSIELGLIVGFGDESDITDVTDASDRSSPWRAWNDFIEETARRDGISFAEAMSQERARVMSSVSTSEYLHRAQRNFDGMLFEPMEFIDRFYDYYEGPTSADGATPLGRRGLVGTWQVLFWTGLLLMIFLDLLVPKRSTRDQIWERILMKLAIIAMLVQPFVHATHSRYHMGLLIPGAMLVAIRIFGEGSRWPMGRWAGNVASDDHPVAQGLETRALYAAEVAIAGAVAITMMVMLLV